VQVIRKNLRVKRGDVVTLTPYADILYCRKVYILPLDDTIKNVPVSSLFDNYLKPYFQEAYRPIRIGDFFTVDYSGNRMISTEDDMPSVEFKVVDMEGGNPYGIVAPETEIHTEGEPIKRSDVERFCDTCYEDIGGYNSQMTQIRDIVETLLKHPKLFETLGVKPPRGFLLTGPSGCGKTLIAKAVANETGAFFFLIDGPELISELAGRSEGNLRKAFEEANKNPPAIIFIDEIDSIAQTRDKSHGEVEKRIVSQLSILLDGFLNHPNTVVIGATNRPHVIDPALRRFGRFDLEIEVGLPDEHDRLEIFRVHSRYMKLSDDIDRSNIAKDTDGFTGADIAALCTEAAFQCFREKKHLLEGDELDEDFLTSIIITQAHFEGAIATLKTRLAKRKGGSVV
jgi:transitional endoplasmic reticulum ATPase